jgi:hypothetical protein
MITPWSCTVITSLFCLLGFLPSAYAESACVLWTAHHAGLKTYWQWEDAFDRRAACLQVLDQRQRILGVIAPTE